ncbi:MAG: YceI family protein [Chitinophagaceae bacterium]
MKKVLLAIAFVATTFGIFSFTKKGGDVLKVNTTSSKIEWVGSKTGGSHPGYFLLKAGEIELQGGKLTGGKFFIDLASLKVTDGAGEKLEGHLKAPDFFDFAKGTEAVYEITNVKYTAANTASIEGKLTLKGVTAPVNFNATISSADAKNFAGEASFKLDRTAFGINYGIGKVANEVDIKVTLVASK